MNERAEAVMAAKRQYNQQVKDYMKELSIAAKKAKAARKAADAEIKKAIDELIRSIKAAYGIK
jgi:hypothetical protein